MEDLYELYETISLHEYLNDKSIEEIIATLPTLCHINPDTFIQVINHFSDEPGQIDVPYTESTPNFCKTSRTVCKNNYVCNKCWLPHGDDHKCYAYDRILVELAINNCGDYFINSDDFVDKYSYCRHSDLKPNQRYQYGVEDFGCRGTYITYIKIGTKWFERKCVSCPLFIETHMDESKCLW